MIQYIDKAAIVAEIKELLRANELYLSESATDAARFQKTGAYSVLNDLLHFLDTLEVKEVDLEKEMSKYLGDDWKKDADGVIENEMIAFAKHFFELGLNAQHKNIWHPMSDIIDHPCTILMHAYGDDVWICDAVEILRQSNAKEWAYMDDILPLLGIKSQKGE